MTAEIGEYVVNGKAHPTITIKPDSGDYPTMRFGLKKAMLVVEHVEAIKKFITETKNKEAQNDAPPPQEAKKDTTPINEFNFV